MRTVRTLAFVGILLTVALAIIYRNWVQTSNDRSELILEVAPPSPNADAKVDNIRQKLVGTWCDEYEGKRTMTLQDDGTGTMVVELSGVQAFLVAPKLRFNMHWALDGMKITKKTVGGEPAEKVNLILSTLGDTAVDAIIEIQNDRLLLLDQNGKTQYDWRRASPNDGDAK